MKSSKSTFAADDKSARWDALSPTRCSFRWRHPSYNRGWYVGDPTRSFNGAPPGVAAGFDDEGSKLAQIVHSDADAGRWSTGRTSRYLWHRTLPTVADLISANT